MIADPLRRIFTALSRLEVAPRAQGAADFLAYLALVLPPQNPARLLVGLSVLVSPTVWRGTSLPLVLTAAVGAFATVALLQAAPAWGAIIDGSARLLTGWLPVTVSPYLPLRRSSLILVWMLVLSRGKAGGLGVTVNTVLTVAYIAVSQVLVAYRPELLQVGLLTLGFAAAIEVCNFVSFWKARQAVLPSPFAGALVFALALAAAWPVSVTLDGLPPSSGESRRITFWWPAQDTSEFGTVDQGYGWNTIGHWGELLRLLEADGYTVRRAVALDDAQLTGSGAVVLPGPLRALTIGEHRALRRYVEDGGRLLAVAEHTNLEGVQDEFNPFLEPFGIRINFDTTNNLFGDTLLGTAFGLDPLSTVSARAPFLTHNRGASLSTRGLRAAPIMRGVWWHGDIGNPLAPDQGFLSDYHLSRGDRLGDLTLAARARVGHGMIVVWGDSSPFLNQNLAYNSRFLLEFFRELTSTTPLPRTVAWATLATLAVFLVIGALGRPAHVPRVGLLALGALLVMPVILIREPRFDAPANVAVISDAENNGFSRDPFHPMSVTGLGVYLTRARMIPWIGDWHVLSRPPRALFIVNPKFTPTARYAAGVRRLAERGTTVVIAGGGDSASFVSLVRQFGARVVGAPLGSLPGTEITTYSAWHLVASTGAPVVVNGISVGVVQAVGSGRLVLLADAGFFSSKNLEAETTFDLKNQAFLTRLLTER